MMRRRVGRPVENLGAARSRFLDDVAPHLGAVTDVVKSLPFRVV